MFCHSWFELLLQSWMRARICSNVCWKMKDPSKITAFLDVSAHWSMLIGRNSTGWLLKRNYRLLRLELPHVATKKYSVSCHLYFHSSSKAHAGPANFWTAQSSSAAGNLALKTIENPPSNEVFKAWMLTAAQSLGRTATAHSSGGPPGSQATSCDQPWRSRLQNPMAWPRIGVNPPVPDPVEVLNGLV